MKIVLYTQRVEIIKEYGERRDCADQNIARFIEACGYVPIPVSNVSSSMEEVVAQLNPSGIVFTGGNSLVKYGGNAPERDETERQLMDVALNREIPVFGFCRGMQFILDYFGCPLRDVVGHVAVRHNICEGEGALSGNVNSFHNQGALEGDIKEPLMLLEKTEDGVAEHIRHNSKKIEAIMWHPEREASFAEKDKKRIRILFG